MAAAMIALILGAIAARSWQPAKLAALGVVMYASLAMFQPFLIDRLQQQRFDRALGAEYRPEFNLLRERPQQISELQLHVKNTGSATWKPDGEQPVTIGYHWYDTERRRIVPVAPIHTTIARAVGPQESITLRAAFHTPADPGKYLLSWDLAQETRGWFSRNGVVPGVVEVDIEDDTDPWRGTGDVSRWMKPELQKGSSADAAIGRADLWAAGVRLAVQRPIFGAGPDNFRMLYGRPIGFTYWDKNVRANNLYLELLVGSGLAGLAAFCWMVSRVTWRVTAAPISLAVFLVHGLVDVFLMTTPIYFGFWILMGLSHEDRI
jgi:hypothetical protein